MFTELHPSIIRFRFPIAKVCCLSLLLSLMSFVAAAQTPTSTATATDEKAPRRTPLGSQVPPDRAAPLLRSVAGPEPATDVLQRTGTAQIRQQLSSKDIVSDGTVTVYTSSGPVTFNVRLVHNGEHGSQRILLTQADGKLWDGRGDHLAPGGRQALEFLEAQHSRGMQQLLDSPKREATIADNGIMNASHVLTVQEKNGNATQYVLDTATSRLMRFQFVRGQSQDKFGAVSPIVHSYAFSDVRNADGIATAFHVEHVVNGMKQEELQLTKVRYNSPPTNAPVRPTGK